VENAVDAIVACIRNSAADNQVFNVVDQERVTKKMYMDRLVKPLYPNAIAIYCPMLLLIALTWIQDQLMTILGKQPLLTVYRLLSSQKRITYGTSRIEGAIGWRSRISFEQGAAQVVREHGRVAKFSAPLPPRRLP
jgi:nucleoside-diphosphate-sugar epimerase